MAEIRTVLPLPHLVVKHHVPYIAPIREHIHMLVELFAHLQDASRVPENRDIPADFTKVLLSRLLAMLPHAAGEILSSDRLSAGPRPQRSVHRFYRCRGCRLATPRSS